MVLTMFAFALCLAQSNFQPLEGRLVGPYITAQVRTTDGKDHSFLIDSGSNGCYVLKTAVAPLDKDRDVSIIKLQVGPTEVSANAKPVSAETIPVQLPGIQIEGVIGTNLLRQIQLDVDYTSGSLTARFGGPIGSPGPGYKALLLGKDPDSLFTVSGQIGSKSIRLCVDTGATAVLLDEGRVETAGFRKLPPSKLNSFAGSIQANRFLLDSMSLGDSSLPWVVASGQKWPTRDSDDGIIGTDELGSGHVILDFPGSCVYLAPSDPVSEAARHILGIPVMVDSGGLRFRDGLSGYFQSSSGAKIVAIRAQKSEELVSALSGHGPEAAKALIKAFNAMREPGLVTTERGGERQILPVQVSD